jgi:hypothetical protein
MHFQVRGSLFTVLRSQLVGLAVCRLRLPVGPRSRESITISKGAKDFIAFDTFMPRDQP